MKSDCSIDRMSLSFKNLVQPRNAFLWIIVSLALKSTLFIYKINEPTKYPNNHYRQTFARETGDSRSYIDPAENLVVNGSYQSGVTYRYLCTDIRYEDYRMPGYGAIYYLFRQVTGIVGSLNALVILQLLLSSVSVYYLALIAWFLFKENIFFYLCYFLYVTSVYVSLYDHLIATESFFTASMIFSLYFLVKPGGGRLSLLVSGIFMAWCIFLRPVALPLLLLFPLIYILKQIVGGTFSVKDLLIRSLCFLLPFLVADSVWIVRNYRKHNEFYPLTSGVYYPGVNPSVMLSVHSFIKSYGGSIVSWKSSGDINYFIPGADTTGISFPGDLFNPAFSKDSLLNIRIRITQIENSAPGTQQRRLLEEEVMNRLDAYTESVRRENPFRFHISSRLKCCMSFFVQSGTGNLFEKPGNELTFFALVIKLFCTFSYWLVVLTGIPGMFLLLLAGRHDLMILLTGMAGIFLTFVHPVLLKFDEWRYLVPAYPLLIIASTFILIRMYSLVTSNRRIKH